MDYVEQVLNILLFQFPQRQISQRKAHKQALDIRIDDGVRKVDISTFCCLKNSLTNKVMKAPLDSQLNELSLQQGLGVLGQS